MNSIQMCYDQMNYQPKELSSNEDNNEMPNERSIFPRKKQQQIIDELRLI